MQPNCCTESAEGYNPAHLGFCSLQRCVQQRQETAGMGQQKAAEEAAVSESLASCKKKIAAQHQ